ncbi:GrpB family protein [Clostridium thermosuccinogenes]
MLGLKRGIVELCDHDKAWEQNAALTIEKLKIIFGNIAADIQHVGSTSIRNIKAKPIIDIAVAVRDMGEVMKLVPALEQSGFMYRQHGIEEDMLFVCGDLNTDIRTHHIHVVKSGSKEWHNYINFRNYLNAKPEVAKEYEALKLRLMSEYKTDRQAYTEAKAEFITHILRKAQVWSFLGKTVTVTVDRPLGSVHPKYNDMVYPINYGYLDGVIAPDGEELDVYIFGEDRPLKEFTGRVVAIVHRDDDDEDKLVAIPNGVDFSASEIENAVSFQEKYYDSRIEIFDPKVIHILGASGSGTTTLGKAISEKYGFKHLDTDDFYWLPTDPKYTSKREPSERQRLLAEAIEKAERCVISGSLCSWGDMFIPKFELVILVETPTEVRIERLKQREFNHFGDRILPGGDMYQNHIEFLEWAARYDTAGVEQRSRALHAEWLKKVNCPVILVDGTKPVSEILKKVGLSNG